MEPIKVLVVSSKYPPEYAGSGLRAHNTYKRLSKKFPVSFEVLSGSVTFNQSKVYEIDGVNVTRVARKVFPKARSTRGNKIRPFSLFIERLKHFCNYISEAALSWRYLLANTGRFDLIHVFGKNWVTASAISIAKMIKKPLIVELCNDTPTPHQYEPLLLRLLLGSRFPKGTMIVCISEMLKAMCESHNYKEDIWCRPNPVDESRFFIDREHKMRYRQKCTPFGREDILLVYISYFIPRKNQVFLLDVLKNLPPRYKLLLAGPMALEGPLKKRNSDYLRAIKEKMSEYSLGKRVQLETRFIANADEYLKMSDIFLFPTTPPEGLGTPMLEALSCGIPVVANRIPKVTDCWIKDGRNGYLSDLNSEEFARKTEMAAKIDPDILRQEREELISYCSTRVIDEQYFTMLRKLVKRGQDGQGKLIDNV